MRQVHNRVIPVLTIAKDKLVKTVRFKNSNYLGDPVNAVRIFNDKMVDEILLLDITATKEGREPNYPKIEEICSEAFMPFAYGGGIQKLEQIQKLFKLGIEKVVLNSVLKTDIKLIQKAAAIFGSQSIIASVDVKKVPFSKSYKAYTHSGTKKLKRVLSVYLKELEDAGAGEVFLNSIERDGTYRGYDLDLIKIVSNQLNIPVVACGGASVLSDFKKGIGAGASAVAAGSLFVYSGETKGILINYPDATLLKNEVFLP